MKYEYSQLCTDTDYFEDVVAQLADNMKKDGYKPDKHIWLWAEGGGDLKILDGRHRYEAAEIAGVEPEYKTFEGTEDEAFLHVQELEKEKEAGKPKDTAKQSFDRYYKVRSRGTKPDLKKFADACGVKHETTKGWSMDVNMMLEDEVAVAMIECGAEPSKVKSDYVKPQKRRQEAREKKKAAAIPETPYTSQGDKSRPLDVKVDILDVNEETRLICGQIDHLVNQHDAESIARALGQHLDSGLGMKRRGNILTFLGALRYITEQDDFTAPAQPNLRLIN